MGKIIRHVAGPFEGGMQFCIICGMELCDYRNVMVHPPDAKVSGFAEGELFVQGKNPTVYFNELSEGETAENCKP